MPIQPKSGIRFENFELDLETGELRRDGVALKLQPQPAKVLCLLVKRAGTIVTRKELAEQVWGSETFVDFEQGLNYAIRQIRTALEDDSDQPRFLETLPRRGYRFVGKVESVADATSAPLSTSREPQQTGTISRRPIWTLIAFCVVGALFGVAAWKYFASRPSAETQAPIRSIAVLPLANLSADPEQEYFSEGLTDELTTELAKTGSLRVISRTSAARFQKSQKSAPEIGRELNADALVEGSVQRVGDRVRIHAQLIRADRDQHLWAESYDRGVGDLLQLERDLAQDIARQIGYQIAQKVPAGKGVAAAAHEDYLRGRYFWNKRTEAGLRKGIEYFQSAIHQEPTYALAYAGLADSYIMLANWGFAPPAEAYANAKAAALKAVELDDQLAEAQTSLAYVTLLYDWDWKGAEARFRQAIALNSNYASAHHFYSILLMSAGRQAEALAEIKRAQELDPLSLIVNDVVGWIQYEGRQYDQAIAQYQKTLEIDPTYAPVLLDLGMAYLRKGEYRNAIAQFEKARAAGGENGVVVSGLAQAYGLSGDKAAARKVLKQMQGPKPAVFVTPWDLALVYAALDEKDEAISLLRKAADDHVGWVVRLGVEPALDGLRNEPLFRELVRRVGVPAG